MNRKSIPLPEAMVQFQRQLEQVRSLLVQLLAVNPDDSIVEAIGDWHYWVAQGYQL